MNRRRADGADRRTRSRQRGEGRAGSGRRSGPRHRHRHAARAGVEQRADDRRSVSSSVSSASEACAPPTSASRVGRDDSGDEIDRPAGVPVAAPSASAVKIASAAATSVASSSRAAYSRLPARPAPVRFSVRRPAAVSMVNALACVYVKRGSDQRTSTPAAAGGRRPSGSRRLLVRRGFEDDPHVAAGRGPPGDGRDRAGVGQQVHLHPEAGARRGDRSSTAFRPASGSTTGRGRRPHPR